MFRGPVADRLAGRVGAAALAVVLVLGLFSGVAVGAPGVTAETGLEDAETAAAPIDPALEDADGEVSVLVHLDSPAVDAGEDLTARKAAAEASHERFARSLGDGNAVTVEREFWLTAAVLVTVDTDRIDLETIARTDGVTAIDADRPVSGASDRVVDDADADVDGQADESDGPATGLEQMNAPDAWETYGTRGEGTSVAVLDSGVDGDHPDLEVDEWNDFGDAPSPEPIAYDDHGTHVSGLVAGGNESGTRIGVAPDVDLYHGAVMTDCNSGENCVGYERDIIAGLEWAVESGADVVVLSLGVDGYDTGLLDAIENANDAGTPVVSSIGNQGAETSTSPGNLPETTSVGAVDRSNTVPEFSSSETIDTSETWGEAAPERWPGSYTVPTLAAPGVDVTSTAPGGGYEVKSGTSMAAPAAAGAAALVQSATDRTLDAAELEDVLVETAVDADGDRGGHGVVDVAAAIERAGEYATVEGTAVDEVTGEPIADATVTATADGDSRETTTDADGEFELGGLEADREYELVAERAGYERTSATASVRADDSVTADLSLAGSGTIDVTLTNERFDTAIEDGTVAVTGATGTYPAERTDDGDYRIDGVPVDEEYVLEANAPGYDDRERTIDVSDSTIAEPIALEGDATLEIAVENADGTPVEDATVEIERAGATFEPSERTAADGTLAVTVPGAGESYAVAASGAGLERTTAETGSIGDGATASVTVAPAERGPGAPNPLVLAAIGVLVAVGAARLVRS
ncbi:S8 family serine peptidase [Natronococcus occultus]|uniref:Subtilisin-like serine protease n=1 Tax=Natronococcus occultus SP4 TaxID=694430 RepID=L0K1Q5_9EURY|nr:S8 family serine peptidase [Natronococcus occultus]AGB38480.1 subtilisin-like serine protease [Natronococcus occultus SP4]